MKKIESLQYITPNNTSGLIEKVKSFLEANGKWVQLRLKEVDDEKYTEIAKEIRLLKNKYDFTFILNDRVHLVTSVLADGVHVGLEDMPIVNVRKMLGEDYIIGGSCNSFYDIKYHHKQGADYVGLGPYKNTNTKDNLNPILGLEGYKEIMMLNNLEIPVIGIGGISTKDICSIIETGVSGIAISGEISHASNIHEKTKEILNELELCVH